ncbi:energy-converting hydrogenase B subunit J [Methanobacterium alcaliphilum]|uniref:energy-converting hydrogenase B subunit J n=1 Tax=Methanobacterium alcaliphilum TaxID=392018 RepID=UPI00200A2FFD|nr:energy-converting hydrogenase B subunit J [Methanobacterium alcaliphilum]MCK9151448.1 energy-converting hydrogenase B subunit J [Methanobacterium alcaliphilum]
MLYIGPTLFGFLLGFILGSRIKNNFDSEIHFPLSSYIVVIIAALLMAWQLGPLPYYTDTPIASGFMAAIVGFLAGKVTLGRRLAS